MLKSGMNELWPTYVYKGSVPDEISHPFIDSIFQKIDLDNLQSELKDYDLFEDCEDEAMISFRDNVVWPAFENYLKHIDINIKDFPDRRIRAWITGTRNGYMIPVHNHSGASLSAVFYLMCSDKNKGGELVMMDPRTNANRGYKNQFKPLFANKLYIPSSGEFVIFPSYLYHHTNVFTGTLRLGMPVDLFL